MLDENRAFNEFCDELYMNIHPEEREAFCTFINPDYFPKELDTKVFTSISCRIRQKSGGYFWSEIIFCNATEEDKAAGEDYLILIRDIHEWKEREIKEDAEQRKMFLELQEKYDVLFEENMKDQQTGCYNRKVYVSQRK